MPDIGTYALNGVTYFAGEAPVALAAQVQSPPDDPRFGEVEDVCAAQLRFPSGAIANISSSYTTALNRIALCGDEALATFLPATFTMTTG